MASPRLGVLLLATTVARSVAISFVAITSVYESLILLAGIACLALGVYRLRAGAEASRPFVFGGTFIAFLFLVLSSSPLAPSAVKPPVPALQSAWLVLHVACTFIGEALFACGFVAAIPNWAPGIRRAGPPTIALPTPSSRSDTRSSLQEPWSSAPSGRRLHGEDGGAGILRKPGPWSPGWPTRPTCISA